MKDIPTSPRIKEIRRKKRAKRLRLVMLFLILFIALIWALSYFSDDEHIVIDKIRISGTHILDSEKIEREIRQDMSGKYLYLFSKSNSFIYPHQKIYEDLTIDFPRIDTLSIDREGLKKLNVNITERTGSFLYCGSTVPVNKDEIGENCYYVNNDGYIFDKAPYFSGNVYFKYYLSLPAGISSPLARQMIGIEQFHNLGRFIDGITSLGLKPIYISMGNDGTNSLYLEHGVNDTSPKIIFKNDADLDVLLNDLSLAMGKNEFASEINSKYTRLLYIDLRFKNKVLYKFN